MKIYIKDLVARGKHGFHQHEKEKAQSFKISVELDADNDVAGTSDELDDTLNWSLLRDEIVRIVERNSFNLIERLAREISDQLLKEKFVRKVVVKIDKLEA